MKSASICGLGTTAPNVPVSSIQHFEEEWREHILNKRCRARVCPMVRRKIADFPIRRSRGLVAELPQFLPEGP